MRGIRSLIVHYWRKPMSRGLILTETRGGSLPILKIFYSSEFKKRKHVARALLKPLKTDAGR
uniref:Uncharacterized protein n=1 Tax=Manihot esculenta TaxID=3983 RepID=A0A2C9VRW7_MANES